MENQALATIWKNVLSELEVELGKNNFHLYLKNSSLKELDQGVARLGFRNKGVAYQANSRYYNLVQNVLEKHAQAGKISLIFETDPTLNPPALPSPEEKEPLFAFPKDDAEIIAAAVKRSNLRPDLTFEEFCVSTSNQLAFAAASAVARQPGKAYNPLFLWGGVGVGKTHLMQAVGHEILRKNPKSRVVYAPGEQFTNEIVAAIRQKTTQDFKNKYRSADALLIDDVQFFSGKDTAQEEFFHTFNAIQQNEGQIVMTADRKPADIADLTDRLRSRFEGGMVADISTPDSELKAAICLQKAKKRGVDIPNNVAFLLASRVDNIRSMEGDLQRLIQEAEINHQEITLELAEKILKTPVRSQTVAPRPDGRMILDTVCAFYALPIKAIKGQKRDRLIARPRQTLMYLLKKHTGMTLMEIAEALGGRDHTTIIHGIRQIETLLPGNSRLQDEIAQIESKLDSRF